MPIEVILPKVDMDMATGVIADWHKAEGETVTEGEALFDIETDKATMEVESPGSGALHFVSAQRGDEVPIGQVVAWIFAEGEEVAPPAGAAAPAAATSAAPNGADAAVPSDDDAPSAPAPSAEASEAGANGVRATPLARRLARERGIDLAAVAGSGPRGRITRADIEAAASAPPAAAASAARSDAGAKTGAEKIAQDLGLAYSAIPVSRMREVIAARLTESKSTVPHFYLNAEIEIDALLAMRAQMNKVVEAAGGRRISVNDLLIKACAAALKATPEANASWDGDRIIRYDDAHISVAVSLDGGLVTPVVREAQKKDIQTISAEIADLAARARAGKLSSRDYQGGSFSLSNLGMFGVTSFNAIINPPESMILAVGEGVKRFVPDEAGAPRLATIMSVSLSCDHRVVDGALGAAWLRTFRTLVENPAAMMLS